MGTRTKAGCYTSFKSLHAHKGRLLHKLQESSRAQRQVVAQVARVFTRTKAGCYTSCKSLHARGLLTNAHGRVLADVTRLLTPAPRLLTPAHGQILADVTRLFTPAQGRFLTDLT